MIHRVTLLLFIFCFSFSLSQQTFSNISFSGKGKNDLVITGENNLTVNSTLIVEIIGKSVLENNRGQRSDVYRYSFDNGKTWIDNYVSINPKDDSEKILPLYTLQKNWNLGYSGLSLSFGNPTGHNVNDRWKIDLIVQPISEDLNGVIRHNNKNFIRYKESGGIIIGKNSGDGGGNIGAGGIGLGDDSYMKNTKGYGNIFIGNYTLSNNTSGALNIAIGDYSLNKNSTGSDNVSLGVYSMFDNETGYGNTALGQDVLRYQKTGYMNTGVGAQSLYFNIGGFANAALGNNSLRANISGHHNTGLGNNSILNNQNGNTNTALGSDSFYHLNGGNDNVAVGESAGFKLITGNGNTFLGRRTGSNNLQKKDAVNSTAIGYEAFTDKNNQISIGNENIVEVIFRSKDISVGTIEAPINVSVLKRILLLGIKTFDNNKDAAAGGIAVGEVYKKNDGTLMIRY